MQLRLKVRENPPSQPKRLGMVIHACHPTLTGNIHKKITL
jgi:hypothetical protein